jgi:transposase
VISLETWAEIRYLYGSEGLSQRAIARRLGISRDTVARAIASGSPPKYVRVSGPSAFDPFEPRVRELLTQFPTMPTSVIAERVGWAGSQSWFRKKVALLRPQYAPKDPADRLSYRPGDQAQCDLWFPPARIPLGGGQVDAPPVLVMVSSFSRFITAAMIPSRQTPDLVAGMWSLLAGQFGAVPRRLLWDNETGVGRRGRLVAAVVAFTGALATKVVQLPPYDPESKGIVERANGYLETSFLPGRTFVSPTDFNAQLTEWLPRANARRVRGLGSGLDAVPAELISTDRAAMHTLPPIAPTVGFTSRARLPRDYYLRVLGNDYSIDPTVIGRMVDVHADLETVTARCGGAVVACHPRAWTRHQTITDPTHVTAAARLRAALRTPPRTSPPAQQDDEPAGLVRDLADYDARFGIDFTPTELTPELDNQLDGEGVA